MIKKTSLIGLLIIIGGTILIMGLNGVWNNVFSFQSLKKNNAEGLTEYYDGYSDDGSILLNENSDVALYPLISGSGTAGDPFRIENATLSPVAGEEHCGIFVGVNFTARLVIHNCTIRDFAVGIALHYQTGINVSDNRVSGCGVGIDMVQSKNCSVFHNILSNTGFGIGLMMGSNGNEIEGNSIEGRGSFGTGIIVDSSNYNWISATDITGFYCGIHFGSRSTYNVVSSNDLRGNNRPYRIRDSTFMPPTQNAIDNNQLSLSLNIGDFILLILVAIGACATVIGIVYYRKTKSILSLASLVSCIILTILFLSSVLDSVLYTVPSDIFAVISAFCTIAPFLAILILSEAIEKEHVQGLKLTSLGILTGIYITFYILGPVIWDTARDAYLQADAVRNPAAIIVTLQSIDVTLFPLNVGMNMVILLIDISCLYSLMNIVLVVNFKAPPSLKPAARRALIDAIILTGSFIVLQIAPLIQFNPNLMVNSMYLILFIGMTDLTITFGRHPALGYVLPFRVMQLFVMEARSGIVMFSYTWSRAMAGNEDLFGGYIEAVSQVTKEVVKGSDVKEIKLTNATILIDRDPAAPIVFGMIASRTSAYLRHNLERFKVEFTRDYTPYFDKPNITSNFSSATALVEKNFPLIPETL